MNTGQSVKSYKLIKLIYDLFISLRCPDIISSSKYVTGVNACLYSVIVFNSRDDPAQMFEPVSDVCPLTCCCFQCYVNPPPVSIGAYYIERVDDILYTFIFSC